MRMDAKQIFSMILVACLLGAVAYWYFTKPTIMEKTVIWFFDDIRHGSVQSADDYLMDNSYGKFIKLSRIIDSDGRDIKSEWGETEEQLDTIAREYIPQVRTAVWKFRVVSSRTQRVKSDKNLAYVTITIDFGIKEYIDAPSIPGQVSGTATLKRIDGKWLIEKADFSIKIQGRSIKEYVRGV